MSIHIDITINGRHIATHWAKVHDIEGSELGHIMLVTCMARHNAVLVTNVSLMNSGEKNVFPDPIHIAIDVDGDMSIAIEKPDSKIINICIGAVSGMVSIPG